MPVFYQDNHVKVFKQDSRHMNDVPDNSVHCVITSPPYFGLRNYEGPALIWDEIADCNHEWGSLMFRKNRGSVGDNVTVYSNRHELQGNHTDNGKFCMKCWAWHGQLGNEPNPGLYLNHLALIFKEIKRVLRPDGVCWLNIGDTWWGSGSTGCRSENNLFLKPLDMCLIPGMLASMLRSEGWYIRSEVIWSKKNTMPESVNGWRWERHKVKKGNRGRKQSRLKDHFQDHSGENLTTDAIWENCPGCHKCEKHNGYILKKGSWRPTDSHEVIWMLTKTDSYYCDKDAVIEEYTEPLNRWGGPELKKDTSKTTEYKDFQNIGYSSAFRIGRPMRPDDRGRNLRSVWSFATILYHESHFAVFPKKLPEICIKSSTSEKGCCPKCGTPWARVTFNEKPFDVGRIEESRNIGQQQRKSLPSKERDENGAGWSSNNPVTIGWMPSCNCNAGDPVPCTVLDPFAGSGTVLLVAKTLNRFAIGYEVSEKYCKLIVKRNRQQVIF